MSLGDFSSPFYDLADKLITEVNKTVITLHYKNNELTTIVNTFDNRPDNLDRLGGRVPHQHLDDRRDEDGEDRRETTTSEEITVRAYWDPQETKGDLEKLSLKLNKNVCKIISFTSDVQKLKNAEYIIVDGYTCKMIIDPLPHGLGGTKRYSTSYWSSDV